MRINFILFGSTGDLSHRKLFPALHNIVEANIFQDFHIISIGRKDKSEVDIPGFSEYYQAEFTDKEDIEKLIRDLGNNCYNIFYLAIPPQFYEQVITNLGETSAKFSLQYKSIAIEKPFGYDLQSAQQLNNTLLQYFSENDIYRIDHYLGKKGIEDIINYRFTAKPQHIYVGALETIGIENRAEYYDKTGALKDMVQSHLLQVFSSLFFLNISGDNIHEVKSYIINHLNPLNIEKAQYQGYLQEKLVNPSSTTETYVKVDAQLLMEEYPNLSPINVQFETGKKLTEKKNELILSYDDNTQIHFPLIEGNNLEGSYEKLLIQLINREGTRFVSTSEILSEWKFIEECLNLH